MVVLSVCLSVGVRRHAALRCYLDMDRLVKPRVAALEQLIKEGRAETDKAKEVGHAYRQTDRRLVCVRLTEGGLPAPVPVLLLLLLQVVVWVLQGALRVHSLYLSNGSYMELPLKPLTHLQNWLRAVLAARPDIARIQRRASKLSSKNPGQTEGGHRQAGRGWKEAELREAGRGCGGMHGAGKVLETEVVGNQLLRLAHSPDPTSKALFALPIAEVRGGGAPAAS